MTKWILFLCVTSLLCTCDAYKVLVVFSMPGKSHSILGYGIVKHLLKRGHEVNFNLRFGPHKRNQIRGNTSREIIFYYYFVKIIFVSTTFY